MKSRDGFIQGYNAQAAVDAKAQVIVAHGLSDCAADAGQLIPMTDAVVANAGADGGEDKKKGPKVEAMRERLRDGGFASPYRLREQAVEPVFGQIKHARGFRQFLMRGLNKVSGEWAMICTTHNLLKLAAARTT